MLAVCQKPEIVGRALLAIEFRRFAAMYDLVLHPDSKHWYRDWSEFAEEAKPSVRTAHVLTTGRDFGLKSKAKTGKEILWFWC